MNSYNIHALRSASDLFNTTVFKKAVKERNSDLFKARASRLLELYPEINTTYIGEILSKAYNLLSNGYRIEYFYKNTILNELLSDKQFIQDAAIIFNEFKVHKSIADVVYINGKNRVYEIKTELDSPERLSNQIADYKKMFSEVNVVTHISLYEKYLNLLPDDTIGIYTLDEHLKIINQRKAVADTSNLNLEIMLKTLKKKEIESIINDFLGNSIKTSNVAFFDSCIDILSKYKILDVQQKILECLKLRGLKNREMLLNNNTAVELRYICLTIGFTKDEYEILYSFLKSKIF